MEKSKFIITGLALAISTNCFGIFKLPAQFQTNPKQYYIERSERVSGRQGIGAQAEGDEAEILAEISLKIDEATTNIETKKLAKLIVAELLAKHYQHERLLNYLFIEYNF